MHHEGEGGGKAEKDLIGVDGGDSNDEEFAIVFAAMGVNMETAHFFKQAHAPFRSFNPAAHAYRLQDAVS